MVFEQNTCMMNGNVVKDRRIIVGYALNPKKLRKSDTSSSSSSSSTLSSSTSSSSSSSSSSLLLSTVWKGGGLADILINKKDDDDNVEFVPFNTELDISVHPKYDVIIHKLTEDILSNSEKIVALEKYLLANPDCVIIDPIDNVRKVLQFIIVSYYHSHIYDILGDY